MAAFHDRIDAELAGLREQGLFKAERIITTPQSAEIALADGKVRPWLDGRQVAKVVVVPGRLVNIVTRA